MQNIDRSSYGQDGTFWDESALESSDRLAEAKLPLPQALRTRAYKPGSDSVLGQISSLNTTNCLTLVLDIIVRPVRPLCSDRNNKCRTKAGDDVRFLCSPA